MGICRYIFLLSLWQMNSLLILQDCLFFNLRHFAILLFISRSGYFYAAPLLRAIFPNPAGEAICGNLASYPTGMAISRFVAICSTTSVWTRQFIVSLFLQGKTISQFVEICILTFYTAGGAFSQFAVVYHPAGDAIPQFVAICTPTFAHLHCISEEVQTFCGHQCHKSAQGQMCSRNIDTRIILLCCYMIYNALQITMSLQIAE